VVLGDVRGGGGGRCSLFPGEGRGIGMAAGRVCAGMVFAHPKACLHPHLLPATGQPAGKNSCPYPCPTDIRKYGQNPPPGRTTISIHCGEPLTDAALGGGGAEATPGGHGTWVDAPSAQTTAAFGDLEEQARH
jgi:hypothetical protein